MLPVVEITSHVFDLEELLFLKQTKTNKKTNQTHKQKI